MVVVIQRGPSGERRVVASYGSNTFASTIGTTKLSDRTHRVVVAGHPDIKQAEALQVKEAVRRTGANPDIRNLPGGGHSVNTNFESYARERLAANTSRYNAPPRVVPNTTGQMQLSDLGPAQIRNQLSSPYGEVRSSEYIKGSSPELPVYKRTVLEVVKDVVYPDERGIKKVSFAEAPSGTAAAGVTNVVNAFAVNPIKGAVGIFYAPNYLKEVPGGMKDGKMIMVPYTSSPLLDKMFKFEGERTAKLKDERLQSALFLAATAPAFILTKGLAVGRILRTVTGEVVIAQGISQAAKKPNAEGITEALLTVPLGASIAGWRGPLAFERQTITPKVNILESLRNIKVKGPAGEGVYGPGIEVKPVGYEPTILTSVGLETTSTRFPSLTRNFPLLFSKTGGNQPSEVFTVFGEAMNKFNKLRLNAPSSLPQTGVGTSGFLRSIDYTAAEKTRVGEFLGGLRKLGGAPGGRVPAGEWISKVKSLENPKEFTKAVEEFAKKGDYTLFGSEVSARLPAEITGAKPTAPESSVDFRSKVTGDIDFYSPTKTVEQIQTEMPRLLESTSKIESGLTMKPEELAIYKGQQKVIEFKSGVNQEVLGIGDTAPDRFAGFNVADWRTKPFSNIKSIRSGQQLARKTAGATITSPAGFGETKGFSQGGILGKNTATNVRGLKDVSGTFQEGFGLAERYKSSSNPILRSVGRAAEQNYIRAFKTYSPEQQADILAKLKETTGSDFKVILENSKAKQVVPPSTPTTTYKLFGANVAVSGTQITFLEDGTKTTYDSIVNKPRPESPTVMNAQSPRLRSGPFTGTTYKAASPIISKQTYLVASPTAVEPVKVSQIASVTTTPSPTIPAPSPSPSPSPSPFIIIPSPSPNPQPSPSPISPSPRPSPSPTPRSPSPSPYPSRLPPSIIIRKEKAKVFTDYYKKKKQKEKKEAWVAFIKKKGSFITVSQPTTRQAALDIGARTAKTTLAATFKVVPIEATPIPITTDNTFQKYRGEFREYKVRRGQAITTPDEFVQLRGTRLGTREEVRSIQKAKQNKRWLSI